MPRRPPSHVIADRAVAAVQGVIADAGFMTDVVRHDYGEDLLVQTSHGERVDASRLWIQVKGTQRIARFSRREGFAYSVDSEQALRWARSGDPVVVVLWDVEQGSGYYSLPDVDLIHRDRAERGSRRTTVRFSDDARFDAEAVADLARQSRIGRFRLLMLSYVDNRNDLGLLPPSEAEEALRQADERMTTLALDVLRDYEVVERGDSAPERWTVTTRARAMFLSALIVFRATGLDLVALEATAEDDGSDEALVVRAAIVTVMVHAQDTGLPSALIVPLAQVLVKTLEVVGGLDVLEALDDIVLDLQEIEELQQAFADVRDAALSG
jgi:hypothetical protein